MDALLLARLQFATTVGFHWLFLFLTMGLAPLLAVMHTRSALSRDPAKSAVLERMTRFWGQLYIINYVLGIVTGLVMEFQFGLAWSGLSTFAGNVFGAPLALETLIAFFAESTFLGMWIFGWGRLGKKTHVTLIWLVTITAYASAYWILLANGFMQNPVGYTIRDGVAYLTDFTAVLTNPSALLALGHITGAALLTGGLVMAGVSAYHLLKRHTEQEFFRRSLRLGVVTAVIFGWINSGFGHVQEAFVARIQPAKFAGDSDYNIPAAGQLQQQLAAQYGPGDYIPPGWLDAAFFLMFPLGELLTVVVSIYAVLLIRDWIFRRRTPLRFLVALIPVPFIIAIGGWAFREVGRQPWVIFGELRVDQALSQVTTTGMLISFIAFSTVFAALSIANWTLIARFARRGPAGTQLGAEPQDETANEPALTW